MKLRFFLLCLLLACGDDQASPPRSALAGEFGLRLVVQPPLGSEAGPLTSEAIRLQPSQPSLQLQLPKAERYSVQAVSPEGTPLAAQLSVYDPQARGLRGSLASVFLSAEAPTELRLPPGRYDLQLSPSDPERPAVLLSGRALEGGGQRQLPVPPYRRLTGRVRSAVSAEQGIAGVAVQAIGVESRLRSTVGLTDAQGRFSLRLPASPDTVFELNATPPDKLQPSWSYRAQLPAPSGDSRVDIPLELSSQAQRGRLSLQVVGVDTEGKPAAVQAAQVVLTSTLAGREDALFSVTGSTDKDGQLTLMEPPATTIPVLAVEYLAQVIPPRKSRFARQRQRLDLRGAGAGLKTAQLVLKPRTRIHGQLLGPAGPLGGAWVSLIRLDGEDDALDVQTSTTGHFSLTADPARYALLSQPPAKLGLSGSLRLLDVADLPELAMDPLELPPGRALRVELRGPDGVSLKNTEVRAFFSVAGKPVQVAQCTVEDGDQCALRLPGRLEDLIQAGDD